MFFYIIGFIFVWGGFATLMKGNNAGYLVLIVGIGFFFLGYILKKKIRENKAVISSRSSDTGSEGEDSEGTITFKAVGSTFDCKYSDRYERQDVLRRSGVNDTFHLQEYEWEGKPAFALISDTLNADFGVVPAKLVRKVKEIYDHYTVIGRITKINMIDKRDDTVYYCEVCLEYYEKDPE
ncbi:MAG: hypothetical protein IJ719_14915 [Clostridia bacterium]|nr:hypothetical protein [Clostridia bacterium]